MFILGAAIGSFLCCQARRLRLKETKKQKLGSRSVCLKCKHQLKWYDNIPIISWLILRGKCRKCGKKIGILELLSELGLAIALTLVSLTFDLASATPLSIVIFAILLLLTISLGFLAIYDGMSGELPVFALTISGICAIILVTLKGWAGFTISGFSLELILKPVLAALLFGGVYLILYKISKGKWVGDGDWILAGIIGLALGSPWLALIALFLSNLSATLIMYPLVKKRRSHKIYFGPFLVLAFVLTYTFADFFLSMI